MHLLKVDSQGNSIWENYYFSCIGYGSYCCTSVKEAADGGYLLAGYHAEGESRVSYNGLIVKTDASGVAEWTYENVPTQGGFNSILEASDGNIIVAGWIEKDSVGMAVADMYLAKYTESGQHITNNSSGGIVSQFCLSSAYPNPFNQTTMISYQLKVAGDVILSVYDIMGQEVETLIDDYQSSGNHEITYNAKDLVSGVYFVRLTVDGGQSMAQKIVLMK
jgi:hypothetical protein